LTAIHAFFIGRAQSAFGVVLLLSGGVTPKDSVFMFKKMLRTWMMQQGNLYTQLKSLSPFSLSYWKCTPASTTGYWMELEESV
jgi:hypothetical protein